MKPTIKELAEMMSDNPDGIPGEQDDFASPQIQQEIVSYFESLPPHDSHVTPKDLAQNLPLTFRVAQGMPGFTIVEFIQEMIQLEDALHGYGLIERDIDLYEVQKPWRDTSQEPLGPNHPLQRRKPAELPPIGTPQHRFGPGWDHRS